MVLRADEHAQSAAKTLSLQTGYSVAGRINTQIDMYWPQFKTPKMGICTHVLPHENKQMLQKTVFSGEKFEYVLENTLWNAEHSKYIYIYIFLIYLFIKGNLVEKLPIYEQDRRVK